MVTPTLASAVDGFAGLRVLVIGDAMLDVYRIATGGRLCQEAPVPVATVGDTRRVPGGAANVAANVAALGGHPRLVSVVGDDREAADLRRALHASGVDPSGLVVEAGRRTLSKARILVDGQLVVRVDEGSTAAARPATQAALADAVRSSWATCDAVVVSDYGYGVLGDRILATIAGSQRRAPRILVADAKELHRSRSLGATAVKPNYRQALALVGATPREDPLRERQVLELGPSLLEASGARIVAVTLDTDGAIAFEEGHDAYRTYAKPHRAASAAGAGDTFAAALALGLAGDHPTPTAVELASAAAAIVVGKDGTVTCDVRELRERIAGAGKVVVDHRDLATRIELLRRQGRRIVFTNGCFDLLHRGHVTYLSRAKSLGDVLVVAVNTDESVRTLKGPERPITPLDDRLEVLSALSPVDLVVPFDEPTPERAIEAVRPDVVVKGGDYTIEMLPEAELVERLGGVVRILPYVDDRSTTSLIERIRSGDGAGVA